MDGYGRTKGQNSTLGPTGCFLAISQHILSYFINDNSTLMQLIFLKSVLKIEHFDGYYKPIVNQKNLTNLLLFAVLDLKKNIKWLEKNRS